MAQGTWPVNMIAEEKENQLQLLAASRSGKKKPGGEGTLPTLQHLMKVMQQMQGLSAKEETGKKQPGGEHER
jgi:hypothetical protein